MNANPDCKFWIRRRRLSDASEVFDVDFCGSLFPCVTEDDAHALADKIAAAVNEHTTMTADWSYGVGTEAA